jgi:hypothetical protein
MARSLRRSLAALLSLCRGAGFSALGPPNRPSDRVRGRTLERRRLMGLISSLDSSRMTAQQDDRITRGSSELILRDGVWTLLYRGEEYIRLLDATSRDEAERQIAEMLLVAWRARLNRGSHST